MTKTEETMITGLAFQGYWTFEGPRACNVLRRVQTRYPQYDFDFKAGSHDWRIGRWNTQRCTVTLKKVAQAATQARTER